MSNSSTQPGTNAALVGLPRPAPAGWWLWESIHRQVEPSTTWPLPGVLLMGSVCLAGREEHPDVRWELLHVSRGTHPTSWEVLWGMDALLQLPQGSLLPWSHCCYKEEGRSPDTISVSKKNRLHRRKSEKPALFHPTLHLLPYQPQHLLLIQPHWHCPFSRGGCCNVAVRGARP